MSLVALGIDAAWDRPTPAQLVAARYAFVCRYVGEDSTGKDLSRDEAEQLSAAGVAIVTNYEYNPGDALGGRTAGIRAAIVADREHRAAGGPPDRPIYFSIDRDIVTPASLAACGAYMEGVASVVGIERTGAYAEYEVIKYLFDTARIRWGWQTYAWSPRDVWDKRAQLRQVKNGIRVYGHAVDLDEAHAPDFGQWQIGGAADMSDPAAELAARNAERYLYGTVGLWSHTVTDAETGDPGHPRADVANQLVIHLSEIAADVKAARDAAEAAAGGVEVPVDVVKLAEAFLSALVDAAKTRGLVITLGPPPAG